MKKIFLIRHGNAYDDSWHQTSASHLNKEGITHAEALAKRFMNHKLDAIFCSTMERAKDTCKAFLAYHSDARPIYKDSLREILGDNLSSDEEKDYFIRANFNAIREKVLKAFNEVNKESQGENIFVFTHSGFIRFVVLGLVGGNAEGFFSMRVDFASISVVEVLDTEKMKLTLFNDDLHIGDSL